MRTLIIRLEDFDGDQIVAAQKVIPMAEYAKFPLYTASDVLHNTIQDLETTLDAQMSKQNNESA
jgi:hypothetical protein